MAKSGKAIVIYSQKGDRGMPKGKLPKVSEKQAGPITLSGGGGDKGIPAKKVGKGPSSQWAASMD